MKLKSLFSALFLLFMATICFGQKPALSNSSLFKAMEGSATSTYTGTELKNFVGAGSATVSTVSVVSANGFAGTVATATTTPAITLTTSISGLVKGNGTAISAATSGTDYSAGTSALATGILKSTTTTGALTIAVAGDFPTLNQNTTGSAATLTTPRGIYGNNFDGSAALTGIIASTYGGTANGFTKFTGPATTEKTFTLPNATATILTDNTAVTVAQGGTGAATFTAGFLKASGTTAFTTVATLGNSDLTNSSVTLATPGTSGTDVAWSAGSVALGGTATLNIPSASASARGVITTTAQTLAGLKTFNDGITAISTAGNPAIKLTGTVQSNQLVVSTSPVTLDMTNLGVRVDASGGARVINLPACTTALIGINYDFTRTDANTSNAVTLTTNGSDTFVGGGTTRVIWGQGTAVSCTCGANTVWDLTW